MTERPRHSPENQPLIALPAIDRRLRVLRRFEADLKNDEVGKARSTMRRIIGPHLPWLNNQGIAVTYHGSLQYNDPLNLDMDMALIHEDPNRQYTEQIITALENEFTQPGVWPRETSETDLYDVSIARIRTELEKNQGKKRFSTHDYESYLSETRFVEDASFTLSSALLFEEQRALFERYQREVKELAKNNPWLNGGIIYSLNNVISTRQERRKALGLTSDK